MSADGGLAAVGPLPGDLLVTALLRVVRPEFRVECFVPPAGHFLAPTPCVITTRVRRNASRGLCAAHDAAWRKAYRPEREA